MKDSDRRPAPPVPPRRLKRKNKTVASVTDGVVEAATTSAIRSEPRPRLPPPPPPQRNLPRREIGPQLLPTPEVRGNSSSASYSAENCHSQSITADKLGANEIEEVQPYASTFGTTVCIATGRGSCKKAQAEEPPRRKRDKSKVPRPNEYPPLFFTLQDFQEVMADVEHSYSRTLSNMTTFEPTPKPRGSKISINELPESPDKSEVLFRVTTTNVPFEKSLSEWADPRNDPNHFIFEDYVDRRQIPAQRKSRPSSTKLVLFGDDTFDRGDDDQTISTSRTASRVRFQVDSPSKDKNSEKNLELDSLQNIDSLPLDNLPAESTNQKDESGPNKDEDEFGDIPFDSLLNTANDPPSSLCVDFSEESTSSKSDFQTILVTAMVEPLPLVTVNQKLADEGKSSDSNIDAEGEGSDETLKNENEKMDSTIADAPNYAGGTNEPKSFLGSESEDLGSETISETYKSATFEPLEVKNNSIERKFRKEEKRTLAVDESLRDFVEELSNDDKSPPENLRRNSFLMNMLQEDEPNERVVCKVVATHPKTPIHGSKFDGVRVGGEPSAAVEAKNKLLGELSSSFSAIRLKPVSHFEDLDEKQSASDLKVDSIIIDEVKNRHVNEIRDNENREDDDNVIKHKLNRNLDSVLDSNVVKCNLISEEPIEDSTKLYPRNEPQHRSNVCSKKTDEIIDKNYVGNMNSLCEDESKINFKLTESHKIEANDKNDDDDNHGENQPGNVIIDNNDNNKNNNVDLASRRSVDKCAIVLRCNNNNNNNNNNNSNNNNNNKNNDNNAMTPVDVSYDQSPNNVSIIPGSVKSFVKFYEIQGETSVVSNSNDNIVPGVVPKIKVEAAPNAPDNDGEIISSEKLMIKKPMVTEIENEIKYTIVARKPVLRKHNNTLPTLNKKQVVNQSTDKYYESGEIVSKKTEATESFAMPIKLLKIDGKRNVQFNSDIASIRSATLVQDKRDDGEIEKKKDRRSRSSGSKKSATPAPRTHSAASGVERVIQDVSPSGVTKDVVRSGTTNQSKSVPKSSTSTINEHYTFYCTV